MAMTLLGMCAHDDHGRSLMVVEKNPDDVAKSLFEDEKRRANKEIGRLRAQLATAPDEAPDRMIDGEISMVQAYLSGLSEDTYRYHEKELCPRKNSVIFLPQSLSAEADISQETKHRIAKAQAPTKGGDYLPAKYYHVIAAAFSSCEMVRQGLPVSMAVRTQKTAAWAYRTHSINTELANIRYLKSLEKNVLSVTYPEEARRRLDAYELINKWYVGWDAVGIPTVNLRWAGPTDLETPFGDEKAPPMLKKHLRSFKPKEWTDERYLNAIQKVKSMMVDWDWTMEQHEAGAKFGTQVCRQEPKLSLDFGDRFCKLPEAKPSQDRQKALPPNRAD